MVNYLPHNLKLNQLAMIKTKLLQVINIKLPLTKEEINNMKTIVIQMMKNKVAITLKDTLVKIMTRG